MKRKRHSAEQIISKPREAEVLLQKGQAVPQVCRQLGVAAQTYSYSAENRSALMGEVLETPTLPGRSLSVPISGAEVCSELAKHRAGGPRMHRGPFVPFGSWHSWEIDRGFCFRRPVDSRAARHQAPAGQSACHRSVAR